jgi:hypothetical protein
MDAQVKIAITLSCVTIPGFWIPAVPAVLTLLGILARLEIQATKKAPSAPTKVDFSRKRARVKSLARDGQFFHQG